MTHVRFALLFALSLMLAVADQPSHASVIVNGDFSEFNDDTGLPTGWGRFEDEDGFVFEAPDYDSDNQYVELSENSQIEQTFNLPAGALRLSFEFRMIQIGTGGGSLPDSFQAGLWDGDNPVLGVPFGFFTIDHKSLTFDQQYVTVERFDEINGWERLTLENEPSQSTVWTRETGEEWHRVTLDVVSIAPTEGLLVEFLLNGFEDGRTTTVYVDNVSVSMVPEPATATMFVGLAVSFLVFSRRCRRQKRKKP